MPPLIAQLLINRGVNAPSDLDSFFATSLDSLHDPFLLPGMDKAIQRLRHSLQTGETIGVFGDFDADGIAATALLTLALQSLGARVIPYIPHRITEGYGLNSAALHQLRKDGAGLVITADCGITAVGEIAEAQASGLDVLVTDHHMPLGSLPPAAAIVNPSIPGSPYPFSHLAGVGVAFKLIQGLSQSMGMDWDRSLLELVALGSVADMAPTIGENRTLIAQGLKEMNNHPSPGLKALMEEAGIRQGQVDTEAIAYALAPRINAAGRIDTPIASLQLLTTRYPEQAASLAHLLQEQNQQRQQMTQAVLEKTRIEAQAKSVEKMLLFLGGRDYPAGVVGLAASKLAEEFYRPTIVMEIGEKVSRGSCRSIPEFNIIAALSQCAPLFDRFGGHSQAAGFTIANKNLAELEERLLALAREQLAGLDLRPRLTADAAIHLSQLNREVLPWINRMAPLGYGNPAPVFLTRGIRVLESRSFGNNGEHLQLRLTESGVTWQAIGFNLPVPGEVLSQPLDMVYQLGTSRWQGDERLRLEVLDLRPSS